MMPIAGRPMIARVLDMLANGGAERFIIVVHPEDRGLLEQLKQSSRAARIRLAHQDCRWGMADAVESAAPLVRQEHAPEFLLASCDNLYPEGHVSSLIARRRKDTLDAALTLMWTSRQEATSSAVVVMQDDLVVDIIEKPHSEEIPSCSRGPKVLSAPSLYALSPQVLDYLDEVRLSPRNEREFPDALRLLIGDGGKVGGTLVKERMTLTHPMDLLAINRHFLRVDPERATVEAEMPSDVTIVPPVRIETGARVGSGCQIGPEVYLESGCTVHRGARIRRAVVLCGTKVEANQIVDESVIYCSASGRSMLCR
jgi:bifunctional UDP-N-acetylglucosamine pyrophosphorylase/glucosamine-1-phosphate N-acetyltransferase